MGIVETIGAVATAITALIGLFYFADQEIREQKYKKFIEEGRKIPELINEAKSVFDRQALARLIAKRRQ